MARQDDLYIETDNAILSGWKAFRVTRGIERCPMDFAITVTDITGSLPLTQYDKCRVTLRDDTIITGSIDRFDPSITPQSHDVTISGRSKCKGIVDCSAILTGGNQRINFDLFDLARDLCSPFDITVIDKTANHGQPIPFMTLNLGETPWCVIEKVCRYAGFLTFDDTDGNLVISDVGNTVMASGIYQGGNVQNASASLSSDQRYSDYYVVWQAIDTLSDITAGLGGGSNVHGHATDPDLKAKGIFRPLYMISEQTQNGQDLAQKRAQWEANRRWGRSQQIRVTVDSWRDKSGALWQPNALVDVNIPKCKVSNQRWIISEVTYIKGRDGTTSELCLMPKEAFSVEPIQLYRGNADIFTGLS